jgi:hypothetical protein
VIEVIRSPHFGLNDSGKGHLQWITPLLGPVGSDLFHVVEDPFLGHDP